MLDLGFNRLKSCRYGWMLFHRSPFIGRSLDLYGEYSESEVAIFRKVVRPGNVALDIGANIGAHAIALASLVGNSGVVHAFEPQRVSFMTLCANVVMNNLFNVRCHNSAVGSEVADLLVPVIDPRDDPRSGMLALGGHLEGDQVAQVTVDSFELEACHFAKIDVEGMELGVLNGMLETIRRLSPIVYVENDKEEKSFDLISWLVEFDFDVYWHFAPLYNSNNFFGNSENVFPNATSHNMMCVPKGRELRIRGLEPVLGPEDTAKAAFLRGNVKFPK